MKQNIYELLKGAKIPDDVCNILLGKITAEIGKETVPKKEYNAKSSSVKILEEQLRKKEAETENLRKAADLSDSLSKELSSFRKARNAEINKLNLKIQALEFSYTLDLELLKAGAKNTRAVKALLDLDKLDFYSKEGYSELDRQLKKLMVTEGYLFKITPNPNKANRKKRKRNNKGLKR